MATEGQTFDQWLNNAQMSRHALSQQQLAVLQAAFGFLRRCGCDYYLLRMLSHFLLNCDAGLKVAQTARLVNVSRQTASQQQKKWPDVTRSRDDGGGDGSSRSIMETIT